MNTARTLSGVLSLFVASAALAGPDWVERGDAGSVTATAQRIVGVGLLHSVAGETSEGFGQPDFEDMYIFRITDPSTFKLTIVNANFDASLWLFNLSQANEAFGLLGNLSGDGEGWNPVLGSLSTDGSGASVNAPGVYAFAVSGEGRIPVSNNGAIFSFDSLGELSGPDASGGVLPHIGWSGVGATGSYTILVDGATFVETPTPGVLAVGGLAVAGLGLRRRR